MSDDIRSDLKPADSKKAMRTAAKGAAEFAASKISPDRYWDLYMRYKKEHQGTDKWTRPAFLEFLKDATSAINVVPDNTRIYQKHAYCIRKFERMLESGEIPRFDEDDFPLPPTSRGIPRSVWLKKANNLY